MYFQNIRDSFPDVVLTPLADSMFNRCKSNIAWMEGLMGGASCVAPNWQEWNRPGVYNYKSGDWQSFVERATQAVSSRGDTEEAWTFLKKNLSIARVNEIRYYALTGNMAHATSKSIDLSKSLYSAPKKLEVVHEHSWNQSVR